MILVCDRCKASFLVPASLFTAGPRPVRCGRCGCVWQADGVEQKAARAQAAVAPQAAPAVASFQPPVRPIEPKVEAPRAPRISLREKLAGVSAGLSALVHNKAFEWTSLSLAAFLLVTVMGLILARDPIMRTWPELQATYAQFGFSVLPPPEKLVFQNIHSERRYMDGAMHLVVDGTIASQAEKTQIVPPILAEAVGPGGKTIESWHIDPPAVKLRLGERASFSSAILSPNGAVTEVNLSFAEPPHDEP